MAHYIGWLSHFKFETDNGSLVVTSGKSPGFEETYQIPDGALAADNPMEVIHDELYLDIRDDYESYVS